MGGSLGPTQVDKATQRQHGTVRDMRVSDLGAAAGCHLDQSPDGFYAQLGHWFIQTYYSTDVASPHQSEVPTRRRPVGDR